MTHCITITQLNKLHPCPEDGNRVRNLLRAMNANKAHCFTAAEAVKAGCTLGDIIWVTSSVAIGDKAVERRLRHWMADCATRVLPIYERNYPDDDRPRKAIIASHAFADGKVDAAARGAAWAAAWDAARAAARAAAWDAARAAASAAARDARDAAWDAAWDAEEKWQLTRLVKWLSEPEPKPLRLPKKPEQMK